MKSRSNFKSAYKYLPTGVAFIVVFISCFVLLGWFLNLPSLQSILPRLPKMTFNTALTFILAGLSLLMLSRNPKAGEGRTQWTAVIPAALVTLIGLLTLSQYLFDWNLGIDQLFFRDRAGELESAIPGRPSPHTAATFTLIGLALLLFSGNSRRRTWLAQFLSLTAAFIPLLALVGYIYNATILFRISPYTGMALHTALSFIILCSGLLFLRPSHGLMALMTAPFFGSVLARRLLLAAVSIPLIIGWLIISGEQAGLYDSDLAPVLLAVLSVYTLSAVIWLYAHSLTQVDAVREQAETTLRESEARTRLIIESALDAVITINTESTITGWNSQAETVFGWSSQEALGQSLNLILPPQHRDAHHRGMQHFLATGEGPFLNRRFEITALRRDGAEFPVELTILPIQTGNGFTFSAFIRNIFNRKEAEVALIKSEERFSKAFHSSPAPMTIARQADGAYIEVNESFLQLVECSREEVIGHTSLDLNLVDAEGRAEIRRQLGQLGTIRNIEVQARTKSGRLLSVLTSIENIELAGEACTITTMLDITERKQAEEQFRLVVEASPNAIILVDPAGSISLVNKRAESLFGYTRQELMGQPVEMLVPQQFRTHHSDYRATFFGSPSARPMGAGRDLFGLRKDGSQVPVEIGLNPITTVEGNFVLASIIDITERKRAEAEISDLLQREKAARVETRKLNEELEQRVMERTADLQAANKELESFSYSVSHDLRAPLRSIDGFSQALMEDYRSELDDVAQNYLQRVRTGSQHMAQLIDDLLTLSRVSRAEMRRDTIQLSELAESIADDLHRTDPSRQVTFAITPGLTILADRQLMRSVLENLLGNAWKFTGNCSAARIELDFLLQPDGQQVYYVRDNGAGFDMAYADKLFGAFQRLHSPAEFPGTGIGLASVQRIIHRHGGRIWAEGAVGQGATLYFTVESDQPSS